MWPLLAEWPQEVLPKLAFDAYTAVAALTHDPKIDDLPLQKALEAGCFYVGALGSRKTHGKRLERLRAAGVSDEKLARIHAPIGISDRRAIACRDRGRDPGADHPVASPRQRGGPGARRVKFGPLPVAEANGAIAAHSVEDRERRDPQGYAART